MLTPSKYWRVPWDLQDEAAPSRDLVLPGALADQKKPPTQGHGITLAGYDEMAATGLLRWIGLITGGTGANRTVDWSPANAEIWVDSARGRGFWKAGCFGFAPSKVAGYGLHELWQEHFDGLTIPTVAHGERRLSSQPTSQLPRRPVSSDRLNPIEVIGEPMVGAKAGVVYVLKSAYGYKVGRTGNVPARMRAFGVHLPFIYTIPLCVWFEDCHHAERSYHDRFADKRINGEWFDLDELDVDFIRRRL